ncbi:MAG: amidase [Bryobacteraceae bacterium]
MHPSRREVLATAASLLASACTRPAPRRETAEADVRYYLDRINEVDRFVNSIIELNPDAMRIATELDAERRAGKRRGPLHGMAILVKDNIDTADRMKTTAGSLALVDAPPPKADAPVVARLREAGAVILGKTNLSEWANFRSSLSTSGWSGRGGQTRNPYALDRNPSGSSSGSGAAAAAGLCWAAVGTETDGSIVSPSSINGIVGIKPTVGVLSAAGIIPISHVQDTAGPMAPSVTAATQLLSAMSGGAFSVERALNPRSLDKARIGVARSLFGRHPGVLAVTEKSLDALRKAGAVLVDPVDLPPDSEYGDAEMTAMLYEFKHGLNLYLAARGGPVQSLAAVIAFNEREAAREMPHFKQELLEQAQAKGPLTEKAYLDARDKARRTATSGIDRALDKHGLAAIVAPTGGLSWVTDYVNGDHYNQSCSTDPAVAGYPHITVPAGFVGGLPVGLSFFGRAHSDATLIGLAYAFEQATHARREPRFLAHAAS